MKHLGSKSHFNQVRGKSDVLWLRGQMSVAFGPVCAFLQSSHSQSAVLIEHPWAGGALQGLPDLFFLHK